MPDYQALYGPLIETATKQLYDRVFGQNQIHGNVENLKEAFDAYAAQGRCSRIRVDYEGPFWVFYTAMDWVLGEDKGSNTKLTEDVRFWGLRGGVSTVLTRQGFYQMGMLDRHVIESAVMNI